MREFIISYITIFYFIIVHNRKNGTSSVAKIFWLLPQGKGHLYYQRRGGSMYFTNSLNKSFRDTLYMDLVFYNGLFFLLFIQQTGRTLAEKALEDDRFDAQKWLNFHDVQVRQTHSD